MATSQPAVESTPFYFREAALPEGFPPPGAVGEIVVKEYPAYRAAVLAATPERSTANAMFSPLFGHIKKNQIPMTAPVELTFPGAAGQGEEAPQPEAMAFLYRQPSVGAPGPDGAIVVRDYSPATVLSMAIRGSYTPERFQEGLKRLDAYLDGHPEFRSAGPPRYLAYNSPFVPWFWKLGEVQVPIERVGR